MALRQARLGFGATSPNPRVGAILVREGRVISRGYHHGYGAFHAEVDCLSKLPEGAADATLYVNLEPCCHHGKTPPCTKAIIQAGIKRVVYGLNDPNPLVNGKGLRQLSDAGIEVIGPVLGNESREINRGYLKYHSTARPWVTLKWAQSLDGRIAAAGGDSHWISCPDSLKLAHALRAEHDAVLVGINTVLTDDPQLTVRHVRGHNPRRVILDASLRLEPSAALFSSNAPLIVATGLNAPESKIRVLKERGAEIIALHSDNNGRLDLNALLDELGRRGILYLLVEGGSQVLASFIQQELYDEIVAFLAPALIGCDGISSVGPLGISRANDAVKLRTVKQKVYGRDLALWLRPILPLSEPLIHAD
jgi:diaminohydroxyphosphoribosylaminopyrimidine deaminase/5-amino-6-(5-phosphoribosylamino)uracil reductase